MIKEWITRLRSAFGILVMIPHTIFFSILVTVSGFALTQDQVTFFAKLWANRALWMFGIHIRTRGEENLPTAGGGIILFNHQSLFDIPVLFQSTLKTIRFGAKIELFKVPFFGRAMAAAGTLPIARDNRQEVMRIYKDAEARFKKGMIFVLAPEGTRQTEPKIGKFKKGPFIFAINAGVPVIPTVIRGANEVLPKKTFRVNVGVWSRTVDIEYLPPISTVGLKLEDVDALVERVRTVMVQAYEKPLPN